MHGILGIISLLKCKNLSYKSQDQQALIPAGSQADYLVVITERRRVARILDTEVFHAQDFGIYPIDPSNKGPISHLSEAGPEEAYLLSLLKASVEAAPFFFTYGPYDITNTLQNQADASVMSKPLYERANDTFFWNLHLSQRLINTTQNGAADVRMIVLERANLKH